MRWRKWRLGHKSKASRKLRRGLEFGLGMGEQG